MSELSSFWRQTADQEGHGKSGTNWREKYQRDLNDTLLEEKKEYWKRQVENEAKEHDALVAVERDNVLIEQKRQKWNKIVEKQR